MTSSPSRLSPSHPPTQASIPVSATFLGAGAASSTNETSPSRVGGNQIISVSPEFEAHATHLPPPSVLNVTTPLKSLYHVSQTLLFTGCIVVTFIFSIFETDNLKIRYFLIQQTSESELGSNVSALAACIVAYLGLALLWLGMVVLMISPRVQGKRIAFLNFAACVLFLVSFCLTVQNASSENDTISENQASGNGNGEATFTAAYGFGLAIATFSLSMLAGLMCYALVNQPIIIGLRPLYIRVDEEEVLEACNNPDQLVGQLISPKDPTFHHGAGFKEVKKDSDDESEEGGAEVAGPTLDASSSAGAHQQQPSSPTFVKSPLYDSKKAAIAASLGIVSSSNGALLSLSVRPVSTIQHPSARPDISDSTTSSQYVGTTFASVAQSGRADPIKARRVALLNGHNGGANSAMAFTPIPAPVRKRSAANMRQATSSSVATSTSQPLASPPAGAMSLSESGMHSMRLTGGLDGASKHSSNFEDNHLLAPHPMGTVIGDSSSVPTNSRSADDAADRNSEVGEASPGEDSQHPNNGSIVRVSDLRGYGRDTTRDPLPMGLMTTTRPVADHQDADQDSLGTATRDRNEAKDLHIRASYHTHITTATALGETEPPVVFYEPAPSPTCSLVSLGYLVQILLQVAAIAVGALAIASPQYSRTVVPAQTPSPFEVIEARANIQPPPAGTALPSMYTEGWHYYYGSADVYPFSASADSTNFICSAFSQVFLKAATLTSVASGLQALALLITPLCIVHRLRSAIPIFLQIVVFALLLGNVGPFVRLLENVSGVPSANTTDVIPSSNYTNICRATSAEAEYDSLVVGKGFIGTFIACLLALVAVAAGIAHRLSYTALKQRIADGLESPLLETEDLSKRLKAAGTHEY